MAEFESMQRRARRERRTPKEIRQSLDRKREQHDSKCHARTFYLSTVGVGILLTTPMERHEVECVLPADHAGPHETRIDGAVWLFPKD